MTVVENVEEDKTGIFAYRATGTGVDKVPGGANIGVRNGKRIV